MKLANWNVELPVAPTRRKRLRDWTDTIAADIWDGSSANRAALQAALEDTGLVALTAGDGDPIRRDSNPYACIDHICALRSSRWRGGDDQRQ